MVDPKYTLGASILKHYYKARLGELAAPAIVVLNRRVLPDDHLRTGRNALLFPSETA